MAVYLVDRSLPGITPEQLASLGLPGSGRFFNGYYFPASNLIDGASGFFGQPPEDTQAALDPILNPNNTDNSKPYTRNVSVTRVGDVITVAFQGHYSRFVDMAHT